MSLGVSLDMIFKQRGSLCNFCAYGKVTQKQI